MRIYLASSWRNTYQPTVLAELIAAGHEVYDFRHPAPGNTGFGWSQTIDRPITDAATLLEALAHPRAVEGFGFDYRAMQWADACVLLLPSGNSAHLEAGWFAGRGKPVAVLAPMLKEPELMYKCFDDSDGPTPLFATTAEVIAHLARPASRSPIAHIAAQWFDANGCGPTYFELKLEDFRPALEKLGLGVHAFDAETEEDIAVLPDHEHVLGGGFGMNRAEVAELHRQLGEWLAARPAPRCACGQPGTYGGGVGPTFACCQEHWVAAVQSAPTDEGATP